MTMRHRKEHQRRRFAYTPLFPLQLKTESHIKKHLSKSIYTLRDMNQRVLLYHIFLLSFLTIPSTNNDVSSGN